MHFAFGWDGMGWDGMGWGGTQLVFGVHLVMCPWLDLVAQINSHFQSALVVFLIYIFGITWILTFYFLVNPYSWLYYQVICNVE
jgi:hypothetical protein